MLYMQYVITGSLGYIGKPITAALVNTGYTVTVITSSVDKVSATKALGSKTANEYTKLGRALRNGKMQEDYRSNRPTMLGKMKLEDFALNEFTPAFNAPAPS